MLPYLGKHIKAGAINLTCFLTLTKLFIRRKKIKEQKSHTCTLTCVQMGFPYSGDKIINKNDVHESESMYVVKFLLYL